MSESPGRRVSVLYASPYVEYPPRGGPELRAYWSMAALAKVADVSIYSTRPSHRIGGEKAIAHLESAVGKVYFPPVRDGRTVSAKIERRARALPGLRFATRAMDAARVLGESRSQILWLGHGGLLYGLLPAAWASHKPVVVDTDSVWSRYVLRESLLTQDQGKRARITLEGNLRRVQEVFGTNVADLTTAVSEVDLQYFRRLAIRKSRVDYFPNVIDTKAYTGTPSRGSGCVTQPAICYTGTFHSAANRDAATWLLSDIMPRVWASVPSAHAYVVGRGATPEMLAMNTAHVTVTGEVPSTIAFIQSARLMVVPLRFESGTRFKILEAFACSTPVVSTSLGAEGLDVKDQEHLLIADDAAAIASSIVSVLQNDLELDGMILRARSLVEDHYSLPVAVARAGALLDALSRSHCSRPRTHRK